MKIEKVKNGRGWKVQTETETTYFGEYGVEGCCEGVIYKDYDAFESGEGVCYINEYGFENEEENAYELFEFEKKELCASELIKNPYQSKTGYTRQDFLDMCNGDIEMATSLFYECEWTCPETILDQWADNEEE